MQGRRIVGDRAEQGFDQRVAVLRDIAHAKTGLFEPMQQVDRRGRGIQTDAVADAAVAGRVIGQNQRQALVPVVAGRQLQSARRELGDEARALGVQRVADHRDLAALGDEGLGLEADRTGDDAAVHFRQHHLHRDVATAQALLGLQPVGLGGARQDQLQHRQPPAKRRFESGRLRGEIRARHRAAGEAGGVDDQPRVALFDQRVDQLQRLGILQRRDRDRQRVDPGRFEGVDQAVEHRRVLGLQVTAVEQQDRDRGARIVALPARPPLGEGGLRIGRAGIGPVQQAMRQGLRFAPV